MHMFLITDEYLDRTTTLEDASEVTQISSSTDDQYVVTGKVLEEGSASHTETAHTPQTHVSAASESASHTERAHTPEMFGNGEQTIYV